MKTSVARKAVWLGAAVAAAFLVARSVREASLRHRPPAPDAARPEAPFDPVDEAGRESFPASDPPAF